MTAVVFRPPPPLYGAASPPARARPYGRPAAFAAALAAGIAALLTAGALLVPLRPNPPKEPAPAFVNKAGMKLVWIKPGSFTMGSPKDEEQRGADETPHKVTLTKGFYMAATLVTQLQWEEVMGTDANPSHFKGQDYDEKKILPVDSVSWDECRAFCAKLSAYDGKKYDLPTEAEWEYACRAGTSTTFWWGSSISTDQANYNGKEGYGKDGKATGLYLEKPTPVRQFKPNPWGLYDMHGNLCQWCQDWREPYPEKDVTDPVRLLKGDRDVRVLRGGSWELGPQYCRSASRDSLGPAIRNNIVGCRVVCRPD
jgi:formylglycine-generating enzyme required for sulfatase activity